MRGKKLALIFSILLSNAFGEDIKDVDLRESVASATRYEQLLKDAPASIIIPKDDLLSRPIRDLGDTLQEVPDVSTSISKMGSSSIMIRGLSLEYTLILIDGKRQNLAKGFGGQGFDPTSGFMLPTSMIERIKVIRGLASAIYGSDALSGVINIIAKKNPTKPTGNFGDFNTYIQFADTQQISISNVPICASGWKSTLSRDTLQDDKMIALNSSSNQNYHFYTARIIANAGLYYMYEQFEARPKASQHQNQVALFGEVEYMFMDLISTTLGLRLNYSDLYDAMPNPRFYVNINPTNLFTIKTDVASGISISKLSYLYEGYILDRSNYYYVNKNLQALKSWNYELSFVFDTKPTLITIIGATKGESLNTAPKHNASAKISYKIAGLPTYLKYVGKYKTPTGLNKTANGGINSGFCDYCKDMHLVDLGTSYQSNETWNLNNLFNTNFAEYVETNNGSSYTNLYQRMIPAKNYLINLRASF